MPFVLDASVAAAWVLQDEDEPAAKAALERIAVNEAVVPALFWFEIRNILVLSERRGRITEAQTRQFLRSLALLPISVDSGPEEERVLGLARHHKLTFYDAAYLELAQRRSIRLASMNEALLKAAKAEKTKVVH